MCAFLRAASNTKNATKIKRKPSQKNNEKRTREQHTKTSNNSSTNHPKIIQNGSPEGVLGGPGASWPQGRRQEPPKIDFGGLPGPKKIFGRGRGRPKQIYQPFFAPLKTDTPPGRGGGGCSAPWFWSIFLREPCWRLGGVQKSRGPGFGGPLLGLGGEAKASPTTSKLVV